MNKSINWLSGLSILALFIFVTVYLGCESGSNYNSDGPTDPSGYTINLASSSTVVGPGGSVILTARVFDSSGSPADSVTVYFTLSSTGTSEASAVTGGDGRAVVTLTVTGSTTVTATVEDTSVQLRILVTGGAAASQ